MSYIIKSANPFASTKLTEKGREKLAKGQLTFKSWAIGDSEINYNRELLIDNVTLSGTSKILRPKDKQANLKYFVNNGGTTPLNTFATNDIRCIKAIVNNEADERGYFTGDLATGFLTDLELSAYTKTWGVLDYTYVSGGTEIEIGGVENDDIILLKIGYSGFTNELPTPHLWYKAQSVITGIVTVDRELPNLSGGTVTYIVYNPGEIFENEPEAIAYWDTGTLAFDASCDITVRDVPVWNMNNVFSEDILGITGTTEYEKHVNFGSYDYLGEKDNYLYNPDNDLKKSIAIIHFTNKSISNLYGEFLFIDNAGKTTTIHLPNLMYHRRLFAGSTTGDKMGMTFIASGTTQSVTAGGLVYVNLIEDPTLVNGTPLVVGRVYPNLKIVVIDDAEIVAALSYKSNRNWTLPKLKLTLAPPSLGVGNGSLEANETMYVTYAIDNNSGNGITSSLPCQNYETVTNTTGISQDVQFNINDLGLLPYMRNGVSNTGFYGDTFKVMYQITTGGVRPSTNSWKVIDFTSSVLAGNAINVTLLETQNPLSVTPDFQINQTNDGLATTYSVIDTLSMAPSLSPEILQFGDERFFYGNIQAFIGATIFKTLFNVSINASEFNKTTNITRSSDPTTNPPLIKVSEVGIYDNDGELVIISKLSNPIKLVYGSTIMIELSIDF